MPIHLRLHAQRTDTEQCRYRSEYELRRVDYELSRVMDHKGEAVSEIAGGRVKIVLNGFGNESIFEWLFDPAKRENGEIVTTGGSGTVLEKLTFSGAKAVKYRLHFDANTKDAVSAALTIEANELATDGGLYYKNR